MVDKSLERASWVLGTDRIGYPGINGNVVTPGAVRVTLVFSMARVAAGKCKCYLLSVSVTVRLPLHLAAVR